MAFYLITFNNTETRTMQTVNDEINPIDEIQKWNDEVFCNDNVVSIELMNNPN